MLKIAGFVVAGLFIAFYTLPTTSIFLPLFADKPTVKDWFYAFAADDFDAPQLCDKIRARAYTHWNKGNEYDYLRSACYERLAMITRDATLCSKVRSLTIGLRSGACSRQDCEAVATRSNWGTNCEYRVLNNFDKDVIPFILTGLGYTTTKIKTLSGVSAHDPVHDGPFLGGYIGMPVRSMSTAEKQAFIKTVETADLDAIIKALPKGPSTFELLSPVAGQKIPWNSTVEIKWRFSPGIDVWTGPKIGINIALEQVLNNPDSYAGQIAYIDSDTGNRVVGYINPEGEITDPTIHITDTTIPLSKSYELNIPKFLNGHGFYESDLLKSNKFRIVFDASHLGWGTFGSDVFTIVAQ